MNTKIVGTAPGVCRLLAEDAAPQWARQPEHHTLSCGWRAHPHRRDCAG